MLRQALDAAEGRQQYQEQQRLLNGSGFYPDENSALSSQQQSQASETTTGYGTGASHTTHEADEYSQSRTSGEEDDSYVSGDDWSYTQQPDQQQQQQNIAKGAWNAFKGCFVLIANVENLWDSPDPVSGSSFSSNGIGNTSASNQDSNSAAQERSRSRRRNYLIVLFWFFVLAGAYAAERSSFKLLVDRAGPFRLFSVEMVTATHAAILGLNLLFSIFYQHETRIPLGIPLVDVGYMALLDTFHLLLVFMTGRYVCPTLTVILVQFTLPLSAFLTQFVHPDGRCGRLCCKTSTEEDEHEEENDLERFAYTPVTSNISSNYNEHVTVDSQSQTNSEGMPLSGWGGLSAEHLWGSLVLAIAVILALAPSIYSIIDPGFFIYADPIPLQTAYNTLLYVSSCIPAAASQLYKEHVFLENKQPVNASYLNFLLSLFQFMLASVVTPLVFCLQGLGAGEDWLQLYPSSQFSENFLSGLKCFMGMLDDDAAENDFPEPAKCKMAFGLVFLHAFSIIAVGCAVDKIVNAGATKAMYRGISAGIIVAVIIMYEYDMTLPRFNYGPAVDALNLVCLILLVVGSEVYHRVSISGATFETEYPKMEDLYEDEE